MAWEIYGFIRIRESDKAQLLEEIREDDYADAYRLFPKRVLIGTFVGGWEFRFERHDLDYFDLNEKSVRAFVQACDLFGEDDIPISHSDFWESVKESRGLNSGVGTTRVGELLVWNH